MVADILQAGNTAEPMTGGFDFQQNRAPMTGHRLIEPDKNDARRLVLIHL